MDEDIGHCQSVTVKLVRGGRGDTSGVSDTIWPVERERGTHPGPAIPHSQLTVHRSVVCVRAQQIVMVCETVDY